MLLCTKETDFPDVILVSITVRPIFSAFLEMLRPSNASGSHCFKFFNCMPHVGSPDADRYWSHALPRRSALDLFGALSFALHTATNLSFLILFSAPGTSERETVLRKTALTHMVSSFKNMISTFSWSDYSSTAACRPAKPRTQAGTQYESLISITTNPDPTGQRRFYVGVYLVLDVH